MSIGGPVPVITMGYVGHSLSAVLMPHKTEACLVGERGGG